MTNKKQKKIFLLFFFISLLSMQFVSAQSGKKIPPHTLSTLEGENISSLSFENDGKPYILSFWATWCNPCMKELSALDEIYEEFKDQGFKVIAVNTDDARTRANVVPLVNGRGWEFEFYRDDNGDFRRAMGVNMVPHTFVINGNGEIVYQHTAFYDGMEWEMLEKLEEIAAEN
ncbi:MAG: TlpA disulfide reductase family protein [Bacteroidales bacterium]